MRNSVLHLAAAMAFLVAPCTASEYRRALPGYSFEFPRDYFNHPDFRTEWWYYTGNLQTPDGRRFGYELTFFRHGAGRQPRPAGGVWDVGDIWLAHFALSDLEGRRFHHTERMNRSGAGLAGAEPGLVWNGNWQVRWDLDPGSAAGFSGKRLQAVAEGFTVDLTMRSSKPPVVHGTGGVSQKSAGAGRASHYVSLTRLETAGTVRVNGKDYPVSGLSWMDHEFFTHSLESNQSGWDWFSLQFDDGAELMLYRLRRKDGTIEPQSSGTYIDARGRSRHLRLGEFEIISGRTWTSATTGGTYPVEWSVRVPSLGIDIQVRTRLDAQELAGSSRAAPVYWEGAMAITGTHPGRGYVELTGYAGAVKMGE
jgi:predicted secreted hydrolase